MVVQRLNHREKNKLYQVKKPMTRKRKKSNNKEEKSKKNKKIKKSVYQIVLLILVVGGITISRDVKVYKTQQQLDLLNKEINSVITENEALKVQILKASSLDKIEETAKNKLKMILPTKENMIKLGESQATEGKQ
ncbi:cell division protein FtsL [Clostridium perfringens WAL-14572]|nr:cell division protein FtsL [Clostridium perfringens WAL-14572]